MQCSSCCPFLRHTGFSPFFLKGVYDITGKGIGYHCSIVF